MCQREENLFAVKERKKRALPSQVSAADFLSFWWLQCAWVRFLLIPFLSRGLVARVSARHMWTLSLSAEESVGLCGRKASLEEYSVRVT